MIRALLFATGIFLLILGAQTLVVDRWLISSSGGPVNQAASNYYESRNPFRSASYSQFSNGDGEQRVRVLRTREWMPWSLLAGGAIAVLYSYSLRPHE